MSNQIANRQVIAQVLSKQALSDPNLLVLCSDSRGSASLDSYAEEHKNQYIELGIAEQNLVSVAAGLANCGKRPFVVSPACFLSSRSMEQIRVDVAYSQMNVKLIGISGGVSYGALGMTHHSNQDIAVMASTPGLRVYIPSDRFQTQELMKHLVKDNTPAYVRVGRSATADVYEQNQVSFTMDRAIQVINGNDVCIVACGETVSLAVQAARELQTVGISCRVLDMYCIKPLDVQALREAATQTKGILTIEEHSIVGGLGAMVCQALSFSRIPVLCMGLPDAFPCAGTSSEIFASCGLTVLEIQRKVKELLSL